MYARVCVSVRVCAHGPIYIKGQGPGRRDVTRGRGTRPSPEDPAHPPTPRPHPTPSYDLPGDKRLPGLSGALEVLLLRPSTETHVFRFDNHYLHF